MIWICFGLVWICEVCILKKCYANGVHVIYIYDIGLICAHHMWCLRFLLVSSFPCFFFRCFFVSSLFPRFFVSWFPRFLVSSFLRFLVSSFLCFFVSSFLRFFVSLFPRFFVSSCPLAGSRSQVGGAVSLCFLMVLEYFFLILLIIFFDPLNIFFWYPSRKKPRIFGNIHPLLAWCFLGASLHDTSLPRCQGDSDSTLRNHPGRSPGPQLHVGFVVFVVLLAD